MTSASALNAEATPYNQARNHRKMRRMMDGKLQRNRVGDHMLFTSERLGGPASFVQALINTNTGMEMLEVAEKNLLDYKA
jgi:hypothetical protein